MKLIAFDYDGVLCDSLDANIVMINGILEELGVIGKVTRENFENLPEISFEAVGRSAGLDDIMVDKYLERVHVLNKEIGIKTNLFEGMHEILKILAQKHILAVVSNNRSFLVKETLDREGLSDCFSAITGKDNGETKEERLESLMNQYKIGKKSTYLIGDGVNDIIAAQAASCISVAACWGFQSRERLATCNPDIIMNNPEELLSLL